MSCFEILLDMSNQSRKGRRVRIIWKGFSDMAVLPELGMHRFHADGLVDGLFEARSDGIIQQVDQTRG
jgi:hypothetical protein